VAHLLLDAAPDQDGGASEAREDKVGAAALPGCASQL
jgi:hypothetical protein